MRASRLTVEHGLYALAFLLALGLRTINLGSTPLSDYESNWALQALELTRGGEPAIGANPLYVVVTGALFYLFGDGNSLARLLPAITGSVLVLVPLIFKDLLSTNIRMRMAGIILVFGLAVDPGLVSVARLAGGPMPALVFLLITIGMFVTHKPIFSGLFAGLALLSGPGLLVGVLGLALTWGVTSWLDKFKIMGTYMAVSQPEEVITRQPATVKSFIRMAAVVVLLGSTLFLIVPQGLAGFAATFSTFLGGWLQSSEVPMLRLPISLLVYQTLIVIFGILAILRSWMRLSVEGSEYGLAQRLSLWVFVALLVAMIYPGKQVYDLIWLLVPLWGLAAQEIAHYIPLQETHLTKLIALGQAVLVFTLLLLGGLNFMGLARFRTNEIYYWAVIIGAFVMIFIATLLVASGWSIRAAQLGTVWGVCAILGFLLLSSTWGLSQLRQNSPEELYSIPPAAGQIGLMVDTISELSQWGTGLRNEIDISVTYDAPSLRWALRDFAHASFIHEVTATDIPSIIITSLSENSPTLTQSYRGQDFNSRIYPAWDGVLPPDTIAWLAYRQAPLLQDQIILWGRADLFPGEELDQIEGDATLQE